MKWIARGAAGVLLLLSVAASASAQVDTAAAADSAWLAGETQRAAELYRARLAADRTDGVALIRLGLVHAWAGRFDESLRLLNRLVWFEPGNREARLTRARVLAWAGQYDDAELAYHAMLETSPGDVVALTALAQTLRWQGRDAAALEVVLRALAIAPGDPAALEELRHIEVSTQPRAGPGMVYEHDSDGNRITTFTAAAAARPALRLAVRTDAYVRWADATEPWPAASRRAYGAMATVWRQFEPGWSVSGGIGGSASDAPDAGVTAAVSAAASSPARNRVAGTVSLHRAAFDATALLVQRQVSTTELAASVITRLPAATTARANFSLTRFRGGVSGETNVRTAAGASLARRVREPLMLTLQTRVFGFERADIFDGYFAPDFYGIAELSAHYAVTRGEWTYSVEAAPGVQKVRSDGDFGSTIRAVGAVQYALRPGRVLELTGTYANAGLQSLSPTATGEYRYRSLSLTGRWTFD